VRDSGSKKDGRSSVETVTDHPATEYSDVRSLVKAHVSRKDFQTNDPALGQAVFAWLRARGSVFVFDVETRQAKMLREGKEYLLNTEDDVFMAFVLAQTGLIPRVDRVGKALVEVLKLLTVEHGIKIQRSTWPLVDSRSGDIYLHTNPAYALRLSRTGIEKQQPPMVVEKTLCRCLDEELFVPFEWQAVSDLSGGLRLLKELVLENLAAPVWGRYLAVGWSLSRVLFGDFSSSIILRMGGESTQGKTTALELLSLLFYGVRGATTGTQASLFSIAQKQPILFLDNLESDKVPSVQDFLLLGSQGTARQKRKRGTDSDIVREVPRALIMLSSIEGFTKTELLARTFEIPIDAGRFGRKDFNEDDVSNQIRIHRPEIWNAFLELVARDVIPEWIDGGNQRMSDFLRGLCPDFQKKRGLNHLSAIGAVLKQLVRYIPPYQDVEAPDDAFRRLMGEILSEQNTIAHASESQGNEVVVFFQYLANEFQNQVRHIAEAQKFSRDFGLRNLSVAESGGKITGFSFEAMHAGLFTCFTSLAYLRHVPFSIRSPKHLSERCKEKTLAVLKEQGWRRSEKPGPIINGDRYYKWTWTLEEVV